MAACPHGRVAAHGHVCDTLAASSPQTPPQAAWSAVRTAATHASVARSAWMRNEEGWQQAFARSTRH
jgi:hypothetical protein